MSKILIPTPLRKFTQDAGEVEISGEKVGTLIQGLTEKYPELKKHLLNEDGSIRSFVNIFINEDDIRMLENMETETKGSDTISIIPAIAGGSK